MEKQQMDGSRNYPFFHMVPEEKRGRAEFRGLTPARALGVMRFHATIPGYRPTALARLGNFAKMAGLGAVYVKDESSRFGLNSFKSLGGTWCVANVLAQECGADISRLDFASLKELSSRIGRQHFITATDGNHGRGIAWTASLFGHDCDVFLPEGSSGERVEAIREAGARTMVTDLNYDDTVALAMRTAREKGWILVQDTDAPGYREIPELIMQGYLTMAAEAHGQLGSVRPTHVFLQAGVGSMAGAVAAYCMQAWPSNPPKIVVVETQNAGCLFRTASAGDGRLHSCTGSLETMMAGLACGVPCGLGWDVLKGAACAFAVIDDAASARGMRVLGAPLPGDDRVISGESGAAGFGFLCELLFNPLCAGMRQDLGLDRNSTVLCFSTEGDTDRANYLRVTWDGVPS